MKKIWISALGLTLVLCMTGCGKKDAPAATLATMPETTAAPVTTEAPTTETTVPETETMIIPQFVWEDQQTTEATRETTPEFTLPKKFQELDPTETVYATRDVNIRMEPSVSAKSPGTMKKGQSAERLGTSKDGWSAVVLEDELRYIASKYLTTKAPDTPAANGGKVNETEARDTKYTNHYVNLRVGPGADTGKIGTIPEGAQVTQLAICDNGWIKVSYNGQVGYVAGGYLTGSKPVEKPTDPPATTEPKETTEGTKESTEASKESTEASKESTEASKESTEASKESTEASKESTEASQPSSEASQESSGSNQENNNQNGDNK